MKKKLLVISRRAPYGTSLAREALDVTLAASVYDQDIGMLFMDDGVFQLIKNQNSEEITQKNLSATLSALSLYGVDNIYAHKDSLEDRDLKINELIWDDIKILTSEDVKNLLDQQDHLLSF